MGLEMAEVSAKRCGMMVLGYTLDVCGLGNGRGVSGEIRNDGFGIYLGRVLCLKRLTGAMPVPAIHLF